MTDPPPLYRILETALYVDDLSRAVAFYEDVLGLGVLFSNERMAAFDVSERQVLLLFLRGASAEASETPGGVIPGHDGSGRSTPPSGSRPKTTSRGETVSWSTA